ncbi:unnamed protein product [Arctia plantaginis]|uniref:Major facilitator superfamily (MFS) profile domain-containing protein n=1 Tax=Arctia plantaginis TaxID=874455 RepID=A0A8S1AKC6_ARCPL|nr:unnamed protein product [Arctia plantaginis]CAB3245474.1 unnamed protein product [Arctia plantaginis]
MIIDNIQLDLFKSGVEKPVQAKPGYDGDMLDSVLSHVGDMGRYQKVLYVAMIPFGFIYAFTYFVQMFITVAPQNYWCRVPELAGLSMELRRNLSAPGADTGIWDHCMTFDTNWTEVLNTLTPPPSGTPLIKCQNGWEFEFKDIPYETVATEREWVCDRANYVPIAQSLFFTGSVAGGFLFGWIADRFGRVPALVGTNLVGGLGGIATVFTTGLWDFILCRFLVGMSFDNCFMIVYILVLEYIGPKYRTFAANSAFGFSFGGGAIALPWIAYFIADWRIFIWVTSLPMFIALLAPWILPESTRWLVSIGHVDKAVEVLRSFEKFNKLKIPDNVMDEFVVSSNKAKLEKKQTLITLMKSPRMCMAFVGLVVVHLGCNVVFDGLVRLSDSFGLDFFLTFCLNSVTELPANFILAVVLDRLGRRNLTWAPLVLSGLFITIAIFVTDGASQAGLAIVARFFINISYTVTMQWCVEILPTPFRATGSGALHLVGYFGIIVTPFIVYSERYWSLLPLVTFAITAYVSGAITLGLPETKGQPMPQTIADGEKIIREQSLCGNIKDVEENNKESSVDPGSYKTSHHI